MALISQINDEYPAAETEDINFTKNHIHYSQDELCINIWASIQ